MDQNNYRYRLALISFQVVLSACDPKNECDAHPEVCPGLDIKITSSTLIKKLSPGKLDFSVSFHAPGKPENPDDVKAALVSTADIPCRQALTTDPMPKVALDLPPPSKQADGTLIYSVQPTNTQLASLPLGQAKLCVYGRDIGSADAFVMNKLVKISMPSSFTEPFAKSYTTPKPISISIAKNKRIYLLFSYDPGGNIISRNMKSYTYNSQLFTSTTYNFSIKGGKTVFDPALAGAGAKNIFLLRPNDPKPTQYELNLCDPTDASKECTTGDPVLGGNWNIIDNLTTFAADRNSGAFFVATSSISDGIRGYDTSSLATTANLSSNALWTADKPTGIASDKTILAIGDLAGAQPGKPDGNQEVVAVQNASHNVSVLMQPTMPSPSGAPPKLLSDSSYSHGLQAQLNQALTLGGGTDLAAFTVGDLDGDGLADAVIGFNQQIRVLFNMGNGSFRLSGDYPLSKGEEDSLSLKTSDKIVDIAIGDVDNTIGNELVVLSGAADATITVYPISTM